MRVRMLINITGSRNEQPWPGVGGVVDVPDHEAVDLIANHYAEEAIDAPNADVTAAEPGDENTGADSDGAAVADGSAAAAEDSIDKPASKRQRG